MKEKDLLNILNSMTTEEKFGQLTQSTAEHFLKMDNEDYSSEIVETGPTGDFLGLNEDNIFTIGSVLGVSSAKVINQVQKNNLEKNAHGIPLLFMHDAIHGYKTIFPIPLALSCSWDSEIIKNVASYTAKELRATGIHVNFSPMVDLVRDSRWGRVMEAFGEDHKLAGDLGKAMVYGYQKTDCGNISDDGVAACVKHFACYGAGEGGVDYASVDLSMKEFYGYYIKPYEIAIEAKPWFVMSSFNSINGEAVTGSKFILKDVLRNQLNFEGILISDWGAVIELLNHGVCENPYCAGELAFNAGVDIEMCSTTYMQNGSKFIENNEELEKQLDDAVFKVLKLKNDLGLFENPYVDEKKESTTILSEEIKEFAKVAAIESCVLLKNDNSVLPFKKELKSVVVIGEFAKTNELLGNWACKGSFDDVTSLEVGVKNFLGKDTKVSAYTSLDEFNTTEVKNADAVIVTVGESWELSGEGHSSATIDLGFKQQQLVQAVSKLNSNVACVVFSGRPLVLSSIEPYTKSILWCWYLGTKTGDAVAELLFGKEIPSGKLTMSLPRVNGQMPLRYNHLRSGRPANESTYSSRYQDCEIGPLYRFGHGLSYANIEYSNFEISDNKITENSNINISFDIINKSDFSCKETAILFFEDPVSNIVRPVREMVKYEKVELENFSKVKISFEISLDDLKYTNDKNENLIEKGKINFYLNTNENKIFEVEVL
ncbi:MAG: glycoside hydrolase family 3 N-terminal domain-containing protein [Lachnospirales bacterium]